jgi:hypothetical protein
VTYAYCPAFDFNPKETDMTFDEIMLIIADKTKTDRQKGADLEAAFLKAAKPSVMALQPMKTRKPRKAKVRDVSPASEAANGFAGHSDEQPDNAH